MKAVLIVLSAIMLLGVLSSSYLGGSIQAGINDSLDGLLILAILWSVWALFRFYKHTKSQKHGLEQ